MGVLAFLCTGPDGCESNTTALWIIGLAWVGILAATSIALRRIEMKPPGKIIVFAVVAMAVSSAAFVFALPAAFGTL